MQAKQFIDRMQNNIDMDAIISKLPSTWTDEVKKIRRKKKSLQESKQIYLSMK